jgi:hypothetical protein
MLGLRPISTAPLATQISAPASGALSGTTSLTFSTSANLAGAAALSGASSVSFTTSGDLSIGGDAGALVGTTSVTFSASASLTGVAALSGTTSFGFSPSGDLTINGAVVPPPGPSVVPIGSGGWVGGGERGTVAVYGPLRQQKRRLRRLIDEAEDEDVSARIVAAAKAAHTRDEIARALVAVEAALNQIAEDEDDEDWMMLAA